MLNGEKRFKYFFKCGIGVVVILLSFGVYLQTLPYCFVFLGNLIGIYAGTEYDEANTVIWIMMSVGLLMPYMIVLFKWSRFIWSVTFGSFKNNA